MTSPGDGYDTRQQPQRYKIKDRFAVPRPDVARGHVADELYEAAPDRYTARQNNFHFA